MKQYYKIAFILFLLPLMTVANNDKFKGKYTKEKTLKKEYTVNANAGLEVHNSYGNIDVVSWNENRTVIEVVIRTNGNNEEKVQNKLNDIDVKFSANGSLVTAKTTFKDKSSNWWGGKNNKVKMEINYTIKVPVTNSVNLDNNYGAISLNRIEGNAKISCDYGQLILGDLMAEDNLLTFDYTKKSTINYMRSGKINADYSGFTLNKVDGLELNADYTQSDIGEVSDLNYNCDYGKVNIGKGGTIIGRGDYVNTSIGSINGSLNLNTDYGSINVGNLSKGTNNVVINADYTRIKLGFASDYSFNFDLDFSYANLSGKDNVVITKSHKDNSHKQYEGYHGTNNSGNTVKVTSDYGGVTFIKN